MKFSLDDIKNSPCAHLNPHLFEGSRGTKKSKYNNQKTDVDGIEFDSGKEAGRYCKLKMLERAKLIKDLRLQVEYELNEGGTHSLKYIADFVYHDVTTGQTVVEDCKGFKTKEYRKKKRLMLKVHNIKIFES